MDVEEAPATVEVSRVPHGRHKPISERYALLCQQERANVLRKVYGCMARRARYPPGAVIGLLANLTAAVCSAFTAGQSGTTTIVFPSAALVVFGIIAAICNVLSAYVNRSCVTMIDDKPMLEARNALIKAVQTEEVQAAILKKAIDAVVHDCPPSDSALASQVRRWNKSPPTYGGMGMCTSLTDEARAIRHIFGGMSTDFLVLGKLPDEPVADRV